MADSSYNLRVKQTLTIKPDDFFIRAIPRTGVAPMIVGSKYPTASATSKPNLKPQSVKAEGEMKLHVLYGSNTGTSESFAQRIASSAASKGFYAVVSTLDAASGHLVTAEPTIIITASFEGQPADNAGHFVEDLSNLTGKELEGVNYALFGCGSKDWAATYQRIPRLIDETMELRGAKRLLKRGEGDASESQFFDSFDAWETELWKALGQVRSNELAPESCNIFSGL